MASGGDCCPHRSGLDLWCSDRISPFRDPRATTSSGERTGCARLRDQAPDLGEIPSGPTPQERVDVVKEAYGSLLGDIAYRIEFSALFDPAVPSTQRFQLALLAWDPSAPHASDLAAEVEVAFAEARSHAEKVGWSHLPETSRETARRAQKAVRVALESREPGERKTAAASAAKLLASLSQYYLPVVDPDMPSLIGERKQIVPVR